MDRSRSPFLPTLTATLLLAACGAPEVEPESPGLLIEGVGFATPESVQHDPVADVYLVSNINGDPLAKAGNGFISRVSPEGEVLELRWIDGATEGVELDAPKGMAFRGQTLYVADIDHIRGFDRETGEPVEDIHIDGATFLNGLAVDEVRGILYASDTGFTSENGDFVPAGTDAIYQISLDGEVSVLVQDEELGGPNGLTNSERGLIVAAFGSGRLYAVQPGGEIFEMMPASDRMLDGLLQLPDRGFLISDWSEGAIIRIHPTAEMETVLTGLEAPADIGFDEIRSRLLIPLFMDDAILIVEIEVEVMEF
jgi:hypothetical protein